MTELSDRIARDLQKEGNALIGEDGSGELCHLTLGELFDAVDAIGIEDPRAVIIYGGRWDGAVEIVLPGGRSQ